MTPKKLRLFAKGKKIERQRCDAEMYNWFAAYAIPAVACGIGAAFSKNSHIKYPEQAISLEQAEENEDSNTYDKELQLMLLNEQKWAAQAERKGLPPTIL